MMMVLVTGSGGFLGTRVVSALARRGLRVRALDAAPTGVPAPEGVEAVVGDVCDAALLSSACRGVSCVVHLAARLSGPEAEVVRVAEVGTRALLEAMGAERVPHLVLASSLSVYGSSRDGGLREEDAPLEGDLEGRDAYTRAKLAQERIARALCASSAIRLTVLRPGLLWGRGRDDPATAGFHLGPLRILVEPSRQLPLVHADNCADAFATAVLAGRDGTFDVIDHPELTVDRFERDRRRLSGRRGLRLAVRYRPLRTAVSAVHRLTPAALRPRLPGFAAPARFAARYGPGQVPGRRFRERMDWTPPLSYAECLRETFGAA